MFAASLGDLGQFIAAEGPALGLMALAVPQAPVCTSRFGPQGGQLLLKLDPAATREQLQGAAAKVRAMGWVPRTGWLGLAQYAGCYQTDQTMC